MRRSFSGSAPRLRASRVARKRLPWPLLWQRPPREKEEPRREPSAEEEPRRTLPRANARPRSPRSPARKISSESLRRALAVASAAAPPRRWNPPLAPAAKAGGKTAVAPSLAVAAPANCPMPTSLPRLSEILVGRLAERALAGAREWRGTAAGNCGPGPPAGRFGPPRWRRLLIRRKRWCPPSPDAEKKKGRPQQSMTPSPAPSPQPPPRGCRPPSTARRSSIPGLPHGRADEPALVLGRVGRPGALGRCPAERRSLRATR